MSKENLKKSNSKLENVSGGYKPQPELQEDGTYLWHGIVYNDWFEATEHADAYYFSLNHPGERFPYQTRHYTPRNSEPSNK